MKRVELVFRQRPVPQSELDRDIIKPARREAAIEMPQSRNDHPDDRDLDVGARLVENEEIEALRAWRGCTQAVTCSRLSSWPKFEPRSGSNRRIAARRQDRDGPAAGTASMPSWLDWLAGPGRP